MDFGKVLTRAWDIIWKNKVLWLFGILASCGSQGSYSGSGFNWNAGSFNNSGDLPPGMRQFFFQLERSLERIPPEAIFAVAATIIVAAFILAILFFVLSTYGRVTVIKGALQAEGGQLLRFGSLAQDGLAYLWRGLGLNLLFGLVALVGAVIFGFTAILLTTVTFGLALLCLIPIICLLIPVGIAFGVYVELSNVALVAEDLGVLEAARRGWEVLRGNFGNVALMALILLIGGGVLSFLIALPIAFLALPALLALITGDQGLMLGGLAITGICLVFGIPLVILLNGVLRSYIESAWTLTFLELTAPKAPAKKAAKA